MLTRIQTLRARRYGPFSFDFFLLVLFGLFLCLWAFVIEPSRTIYRKHEIHVKGWPRELSGFSIAFITDFHIGSLHITPEKARNIVSATNALNPDLVLLGGDYVIQDVIGGTPVPSREIAGILSALHAKHGVYGVLGNHDQWDGGPRMLREFKNAGIAMLEDTAAFIEVGNQGFWLAGISDFNEGRHDVEKALSPIHTNAPIIALTHSPDIFPNVPSRVALTLAGHTHGGQVYVPFLGRPVIPSIYKQRYAKGLIEENGKLLFVGTGIGIGTSIIPARFLTPPEVSILKLYPASTK